MLRLQVGFALFPGSTGEHANADQLFPNETLRERKRLREQKKEYQRRSDRNIGSLGR